MFAKHSPVYNIRFAMLCMASLFFSASFNMLIPELPAYLSGLGGAEYKGLIISLFTLTAGLSRPFSGKLTDAIGRKPVMIVGTVVCLVCGFLYPILGSVVGFLLLRLFHGFSTGFTPTAITTYVSDIVPKDRWGEALGLQGLSFSTGLALGPAIGSMIKLYYSFDVLFYSSSALAVLSMVFVLNMKETLVEKKPFKLSILKISRKDVIAREVMPAAVVTFLSYIVFGVMLTLIPDWSEHLGLVNKGSFFIVFTFASLLVRVISGKLSDRYGRIPVIYIALIFVATGWIIMGFLPNFTGLILGAIIYGIAVGILSPAVNAWTVDLSLPGQRGKAISTMFIALEAGIGVGALISGWYYENDVTKLPSIMFGCSAMAMLAILYMLTQGKKKLTTPLPI